MRAKNKRMLRRADQASETSAVAFLLCKKRRLVATVLRLFACKYKQKRLFWHWLFWYFFANQKSTKEQIFRRKPLKKIGYST